jgi:hypothetical protein
MVKVFPLFFPFHHTRGKGGLPFPTPSPFPSLLFIPPTFHPSFFIGKSYMHSMGLEPTTHPPQFPLFFIEYVPFELKLIGYFPFLLPNMVTLQNLFQEDSNLASDGME